MVLPMSGIYLLSVGPDQTLLPPDTSIDVAPGLCEPCVGRRRLRLVGGILVLAVIIEGRLTVATLGVLEGDVAF